MNFGFTNDDSEIKRVKDWRDAAINDGWSHKPTYNNEAEDRAISLDKDRFHAMIFMRTDIGKWKYEANITVWGPDGSVVEAGKIYSMEHLMKGLKRCHFCKKTNVETKRVGFADRVCLECYPEAQKRIEFPGWCD